MIFKTENFPIKIKKEERMVLRLSGGFMTGSTYYIVEGEKTRKPSSYEYKKIYKLLKEEREYQEMKDEKYNLKNERSL